MSKSSVVFLGTVREIIRVKTPVNPRSPGTATARGIRAALEVSESYMGTESVGSRVEVDEGDPSCRFPFQLGQQYVVFAGKDQEGILHTGLCTYTKLASDSRGALAYLRSFTPNNPPTFIHGRVGDADKRIGPPYQRYLYEPVAGATVTLKGAGEAKRLTTNWFGEFQFDSLTPGEYEIAIEKPGYVSQTNRKRVSVKRGSCNEVSGFLKADAQAVAK